MCKVTNEEVVAAGSEIWVNRKGEKIAVSEMSDAHVRNAFVKLLKKIRERGNGRNDTEVKDMSVLMDEEVRLEQERKDEDAKIAANFAPGASDLQA